MLSCCSLHLLQQILDEVLLLRTEIPVDKLLLQIGLLLPDVSKIGRCSSVIATSIRIIVVEVNALLRVLGSPLRGHLANLLLQLPHPAQHSLQGQKVSAKAAAAR